MYTAKEKQEAAEREVKFRLRVYGRLVQTGGMSQQDADNKIAVMREIADDYASLAKKERLL